MISLIFVDLVSRPSAIPLTTRSRSVTIPISLLLAWLSITGMGPTSSDFISVAACSIVSSGTQQTTLLVMISPQVINGGSPSRFLDRAFPFRQSAEQEQ